MQRKKRNHLQEIKAMSTRDDILQEISLPKKVTKRKDQKPRKKPEMREKAFEDMCLWWLNMQPGIEARKVESDPVYNKRWSCDGHSDILVFATKWKMIFYIEIKTSKGRQRDSQKVFESWCNACGVPYLILRSMSEVRNVFKS